MVSQIPMASPLARDRATAPTCAPPVPAPRSGSEVDGHARVDAAALADVVRPIEEGRVRTLADRVAVPLAALVHRPCDAVARGDVDLDAVDAVGQVDDAREHTVAEVAHLPLLPRQQVQLERLAHARIG